VGRSKREIIPASVYVGHLSTANPRWSSYELDDKVSVIIDYSDRVRDEMRLVNYEKGERRLSGGGGGGDG